MSRSKKTPRRTTDSLETDADFEQSIAPDIKAMAIDARDKAVKVQRAAYQAATFDPMALSYLQSQGQGREFLKPNVGSLPPTEIFHLGDRSKTLIENLKSANKEVEIREVAAGNLEKIGTTLSAPRPTTAKRNPSPKAKTMTPPVTVVEPKKTWLNRAGEAVRAAMTWVRAKLESFTKKPEQTAMTTATPPSSPREVTTQFHPDGGLPKAHSQGKGGQRVV